MQLRKLHSADAEEGFRLTQQCGWPHRLVDWQLLLALGEGYAMEHDGKVIATAMAWCWGTDYASVGVVVVDKAWQGKGIGKQLMQALIADYPERQLRLHATQEGAGLYAKLGFEARGTLSQFQTAQLPNVALPQLPEGYQVRLATAEQRPQLEELAYCATGMRRPQLYDYLLREQRVFILTNQQGELLGSLGCHQFGRGFSLGPCYVYQRDGLHPFLQTVLSYLPGEFVRLDINEKWVSEAWLTQWSLTRVDSPQVMVREGNIPSFTPTAIAVTVMTPALG